MEMMAPLNLPIYPFRFKALGQKKMIFDEVRKKFVVLTPEEWVRQNFIRFLITEKNFPASLINIEKKVIYNTLKKRYDVLVYQNTTPLVLIECKSQEIKLTQTVLDQLARYNFDLKVKYLVVTNGLQHIYCIMDYSNRTYHFIEELPEYGLL